MVRYQVLYRLYSANTHRILILRYSRGIIGYITDTFVLRDQILDQLQCSIIVVRFGITLTQFCINFSYRSRTTPKVFRFQPIPLLYFHDSPFNDIPKKETHLDMRIIVNINETVMLSLKSHPLWGDQYKRQTNKHQTNKRRTNKRQTNKHQTNKRRTNKRQANRRQTNKRRTNKRQTNKPWTNKRRTGTNVELRHTSDWYIYKGKRQTFVEFENKIIHCYKK